MIIGIDASKTTSKQKTGIDNTAYQIILHLRKIDKNNTYYLYTNKPLEKELLNSNFHQKLIPFPRLWNKFRLPLALLKDKPDKYLALTNGVPPISPKDSIILIHDLAFKFFPKAYSKVELTLQESAINTAVNKAKCIIFTSEANKADFLKFYKYPENQIRVARLGFNSELYKKIPSPKNCLDFNSPFFLFVGRLEARKNVSGLLKAFELFKEKNKTDHKLVLVGKKGYGSEEIDEIIRESKTLTDNVIVPGYITDKQLANLYNLAEAFVFPSLYEGFGLPILEAFACGTPVMTSDIPTLREVASDCVVYVNPLDVNSIAKGLLKISSDLQLQKALEKKGFHQLSKFSWEKTAEAFLDILEN